MTPSPGSPARGLWVWDQPRPGDLVAFAVSRGVRDLFVSLPLPRDPRWEDRLAWSRTVARTAGSWGLRLAALGGDPGWVDDPDAALGWQRAALASDLFDAVHLDLEAWTHPGWDTDRALVVRRYLDVVRRLVDTASAPVEADLAVWLWQERTDDGRRLDAALVETVGAVTVLAYRTTAAAVRELAAPTLAAATAAGATVRLGLDTSDRGPGGGDQTFYGRPETEMTRVCRELDASMAGGAAYAGIAVHDHAGYRALS